MKVPSSFHAATGCGARCPSRSPARWSVSGWLLLAAREPTTPASPKSVRLAVDERRPGSPSTCGISSLVTPTVDHSRNRNRGCEGGLKILEKPAAIAS